MDDLIITIAYFSIPIQLVVSLYHYPRLAHMPMRILILCVLFALFIFLCGAGHLSRCLGYAGTSAFLVLNAMTSLISLSTAIYLIPLVPSLMSDLDESLQRLVKLNEETAESKRKLFTFMAFLCHEIRNPLFAITSTLEFASDMEMTQEMDSALNSIHQSTTLMLRLVNDVLDLSKIESGKLQLDDHEFDLREFLQNIASSMTNQVRHKSHGKVNFAFCMAQAVPQIVRCDSVRVLQIAYNILSNAAKFTQTGSITFSASVEKLAHAMDKGHVVGAAVGIKAAVAASGSDTASVSTAESNDSSNDEDNGTCAVEYGDQQADNFSMSLLQSVEEGRALSSTYLDNEAANEEVMVLKMKFEDTGTGIAKERMNRIFQPYSQSKLSDFRKHGGTGLGLSIIAKLTEMMGGTIHVDSVEGQGSKFVVYLPIVVPKNQSVDAGAALSYATTQEYLEHTGETPLPHHRITDPDPTDQQQQAQPQAPPQPPHVMDAVTPRNPGALFALDVSIQSPPSAPLFHLAPQQEPSATSGSMSTPSPLFSTTTPPIPSSTATLAPSPLFSMAPPSAASSTATAHSSMPPPGSLPTNTVNAAEKPRLMVKRSPLPKFQLEKNSNLVLVVDDNSVSFISFLEYHTW